MGSYQRPGLDHLSYGTLGGATGLMPVIESIGFFGGQAMGPWIRSNGQPSPATLPPGSSADQPSYGTLGGSGGGLSWPLILILVGAGIVGILLVHHMTWR